MEKKMKETLQKEDFSISPPKALQTSLHKEKDSENFQKFKKYSGGLDKILQLFDNLHEWADYISFLSKLLKILHTYPTFSVIPYQDLVACRLAQCLDPSLPSGVHQKTLEVYFYIFSLIGKNGLTESLALWTSGLSPVLMFASTKIKPYFLGLIETFYLPLGPDLRPCAKSLIMSLLPGLEEDSGEYFNETFNVLDSIRKKLNDESFFWQCLWLCIITSPQQRQGALKYLFKSFPILKDKSDDIFPIMHPDSGLFIRAFSSGLSDKQMLICRGFLELLVQNVPLSSFIFQENVVHTDAELLVMSAIKVVLGKEISLSRRVWSWLMGSDLEQNPTEDFYFKNYSMKYVIGCIKGYLDVNKNDLVKLDEVFKILLSLMDRPMIGNIVVSELFLPVLRAIYILDEFNNNELYNNTLFSAREFFDSVDSRLIWSKILSLVDKRYVSDVSDYEFALYIISNFNVHEQDMVLFHIPMVLYVIVSNILDKSENVESEKILLFIAHKLISFIPNNNLSSVLFGEYSSEDRISLKNSVGKYYQNPLSSESNTEMSNEMVMDSIFCLLIENIEYYLNDTFYLFEILQLTYEFIPKALWCSFFQKKKILDIIASLLGFDDLTFDHIYYLVKIIIELFKRTWINIDDINNDKLLIPLVLCIWDYFSPENLKYHIDASRLLWTLHKTLNGSFIETIIVYSMNIRESAYTASLKFITLWKYSVDESLFTHIFARPSLIMVGFLRSNDIHTKLLVKSWIETLNTSFIRLLDIVITKLLSLDIICSPKNEVIQELEISLLRFKETDDMSMLTYYVSVCVEIIESGGINLLDYAFTELLNVDIDKSNLLSKYSLVSSDMSYISILARIAIRTLHMFPELESQKLEPMVINLHFLASKLLFYIISKCNLYDHEFIEILLKRLIIKNFIYGNIFDKYVFDILYIILKRNISQYEAIFKDVFLYNIHSLSINETHGDNSEKIASTNILLMLVKLFIVRLSTTHIPSNVEILIDFYKRCLELFTNEMFQIFIPFVETLCNQINSAVVGLETDFSDSKIKSLFSYEIILHCFEGLKYTIVWALEDQDHKLDDFSRKSSENIGFFGNVISGVFALEAPSTVNLHIDSRNSIILCFRDIVKLAFYVWSWLECNVTTVSIGKLETYKFINMRLKTASRQLLYVLYDIKPLETLESLISSINKTDNKIEERIFCFLSKFDDSRKQEIIPFLISSISSRINHEFVTGKHKSNIAIPATPSSVISFLINFVEFSEASLLKQNWSACLVFLKEMINSPQQYQIIDIFILQFSTLLIRKLVETNFNNEKRDKKEMIVDIYLRILSFFTSKSSKIHDSNLLLNKDITCQSDFDNYDDIEKKREFSDGTDELSKNNELSSSSAFWNHELNSVLLKYVIPSLPKIITNNEKLVYACSIIMTNVIGSEHRNSQLPRKYSEDALILLSKLVELSGSSKFWRKEVIDIFNDNSFFAMSLDEAMLWIPIIKQLYNNDKDKLFEILNKSSFYSSSSIFVFRESEVLSRKYQLKRLIFIIVSSGKDKYSDKIKDIENVVLEHIKGPLRKSLRKEVFLLIRALIVYVSSIHLTSFWTVILSELRHSFAELLESDLPWNQDLLDLLLDACKLLDVILVIEPEEFLLYKWIFITDTIDSVHSSDKWRPVALVDKLFHKIFTFLHKLVCIDGSPQPSQDFIDIDAHSKRSPMLISKAIRDVSDIKPFLSRIKEINYENSYNFCSPDIKACEMGILRDLF
ncbi:hypothetical protein PORY_002396 [Pneumocystis oryctolagi]|uniref:Uncharacterized protein n=1 Tax=Pneumocystis oryctolagi TaxID=42067 RepID=A0ACB7CA11_9ASCO|nr:hypothetical protein PORY_002396 [Pneumocystis oryctolagi]